MRIIGIDFTSVPRRRKPITALACTLAGNHLVAEDLQLWSAFDDFENALAGSGPWIAGIDFPFGQSRKFVETIGWPASWREYVDHVGTMTRMEFKSGLDAYRKDRAAGDKEHRRQTDAAAGSISPQKLYGVPVGLMFYEGAPRIRRAGVTVPMLQQGDPERIVVEAYPGVLARHFLGRRSYKNDTKKKQSSDQHAARHELLAALHSERLMHTYGLKLTAPASLADDPGGDHLDALLCAVQAAWAWLRRDDNFGAPSGTDPLEGWIADPLR